MIAGYLARRCGERRMQKLFLACVLLVAGLAISFSQESSPGEAERKAETSQKNDQISNPFYGMAAQFPSWYFEKPFPFIVNINTGKHADEKSQCAEPKDWKEWGAFAWCRSLEWIDPERATAIFIAILTFATFFLWLSIRKLAKVANKTAASQLRAYISVTPKQVLNWGHKTNNLGISFDIVNHGQSIGSDIRHSFSMAILDAPLPSGHVFAKPERQHDQTISLFPGMIVPVRLYLDSLLTADEIEDIEKGEKRFHTWGTMSYRDAFQKMRTTRFSFSFGGPDFANSMKKVPGTTWNWEHGPHHNDAT
jgi:hypothetical protein